MSDPETLYAQLTSGAPASSTSRADTLGDVAADLVVVRSDMVAAAETPAWSGAAAASFQGRAAGLQAGVRVLRGTLAQGAGALRTAAQALTDAQADAAVVVNQWRSLTPTGTFVDAIVERAFTAAVQQVCTSYNQQLVGIDAALNGQDVDLESLDEETREWVEHGGGRTADWLAGDGAGSLLGPLIPNTYAAGDGRGLVPQGLGVTDDGTLVQTYYREDGTSVLSLVDPDTGEELAEVELLGRGGEGTPAHAGGVTVAGDQVIVSATGGTVYTYSLSDIRGPGGSVAPVTDGVHDLSGGSYTAFHDGLLYSGSHADDELFVYRKVGSTWVQVDRISTPENAQGVVVRDGQLVFSTSAGRHNESALVVTDLDGAEVSRHPLPNLSQGVVELDGELITSYESAAEDYSESSANGRGWWWGVPDHYVDETLWANPYYTRTPLDVLGLAPEDFTVETGSLRSAAGEYETAADDIGGAATTVDGVTVEASAFGSVPAAGTLATTLQHLVDRSADSLVTGRDGVVALAEDLRLVADAYDRTDDDVAVSFGGP